MDKDAITFNQPTSHRPPSRRDVLWDELAQVHAQFGLDSPTATYTMKILRQK